MNKKGHQRGFTLLEVLAAMTLFAIVATGVAALATQSMRRTSQNRNATGGVLLAQDELERVRGLPYDSIANTSSTTSLNGVNYTVATGVEDNTPAANMKRVTVTVSWNAPGGTKSYAVQTIYTNVDAAS